MIIVGLINRLTGALEARVNVSPMSASGYVIQGMPDGEYELYAEVSGADEIMRSRPRRVVIAGRDVTGLELTLETMAEIRGQLRLEAYKPEAANQKACAWQTRRAMDDMLFQVTREASDPVAEYFLRNMDFYRMSGPNDKGELRFRGMDAGAWRLQFKMPGPELYLQSLALKRPVTPDAPDTTDILRRGMTIRGGEKYGDVMVTVASGAAMLSGKVTDAAGCASDST
ncbi:MAG: hypothetical protein ACKV2V_01155 [Blastocatellia bacterium]